MSINALNKTDTTANKLRIQCPEENARSSKIIATTWPITIAPMPHTTNISVRPPATTPIPVAFCLEMPKSVWPSPTRMGAQGAHASTKPQRKRFLFNSSTQLPTSASCGDSRPRLSGRAQLDRLLRHLPPLPLRHPGRLSFTLCLLHRNLPREV